LTEHIRNSREILIISPALLEAATKRGGGIEEIDYQIALKLSRHFKVTIFTPYYKNYKKRILINKNLILEEMMFPAINKYPPTSLMQKSYISFFLIPIFSIILFVRSILFIKEKRQLIVIVHSGLPGLSAALVARFFKKRIIYSEGNLSPWIDLYVESGKLSMMTKSINLIDININKAISSLSTFIRVQSQLIKKGMVNHGIEQSKIILIPGGVDTDRFRPFSDGIDSVLNMKIGFIGRLTKEKGVKLLIDIIQLSLVELPTTRFIILGDGPFFNKLSKFSNIEHIGFVNGKELIAYLSRIHVVLFFQKDIGLAELEAMASGKVIVACDFEEVAQSITHLENGILCPPDARCYLAAIKNLIIHPILYNNLSTNARGTALDKFSWDRIGSDWYNLCIGCFEMGDY